MRQSWHDLTFFHRKFPADLIQPLIPAMLTVQTFKGDAFVGFVPFVMQHVRINGMPTLPNHQSFLETNIRTYVTDEQGRPGVWFFSLDCNDDLAIKAARLGFGLNYLNANLTLQRLDNQIFYSGKRTINSNCAYKGQVSSSGACTEAVRFSLEFWLVERYLLFARRRNKILCGQVSHLPYKICKPQNAICYENMITGTTGLPHLTRWDHVLFSPGVDVKVYAPKVIATF